MYDIEIIEALKEYVKKEQEKEYSGHDWRHSERVWRTAKRIGEEEGADLYVVELAALGHDLEDSKITGDDVSGTKKLRAFLTDKGVLDHIIDHVCDIIENVDYRGAKVAEPRRTLEGKCVFDADKLDATGAMGIARTFAFGGRFGRDIHNPDIKPELHETYEAYKNSESTSINHFYEKLFLLKDKMYTATGKKIAAQRHKFMELFIEKFMDEWEGKA